MSLYEVDEQFDIPRVKAFYAYCRYSPPVHIAVARGILGIKMPEKVDDKDREDFIMSMLQ